MITKLGCESNKRTWSKFRQPVQRKHILFQRRDILLPQLLRYLRGW